MEKGKEKYAREGVKSADYIIGLLLAKHQVITGRFDAGENIVHEGSPIEAELRISENKTTFPISDMPEF